VTAWVVTGYLCTTTTCSQRQLTAVIIICPIAIAYSMGQIIESVCVCLSVCPCVVTLTVAFLCRFSPYLTQRCKLPKVRTSSLGVQYRPTSSPILPLKIAIFDPEVLKIHANMKNAISALNVHVSPKFPRLKGHRGRRTRW